MTQKQEKEKAKNLRKSRWWQTLVTKAQCYYCQKPMQKEEVTMDHIVPLAQGGKSTRGNLVPACKPCNTEKKDKTAYEFFSDKL
mgnify:CR=1 FL=1